MSDATERKKKLALLASKRSKSVKSYDDEDDGQLYDLVDEDQYRRQQMDENFVDVNDGNHGYLYGDGTNELGDEYYSEEEDGSESTRRNGKQSRKRKSKEESAPPPPKKPAHKNIMSFMAPAIKEKKVNISLK